MDVQPFIDIENKTNQWISLVENDKQDKNKLDSILELFDKEGVLWGTFSQILRNNPLKIREYFNYFSNISGLKSIKTDFKMSCVTDDVYINNALISWESNNEDDLEEKKQLITRMTFVFKKNSITNDWFIFELHSSELPLSNNNIK